MGKVLKKLCLICVIACLVSCIVEIRNTEVRAEEYPIVPITSIYPISTGNNVAVYSSVGGSRFGTIYGTDSCRISEFYDSGWCKVTYPVSKGTKTGYCKITEFISNTSYARCKLSLKSSATVYRRSNLAVSMGTSYTTDTVIAVGETSNAYQIIYNVSGGYKCGWINKENVIMSQVSGAYPIPILQAYMIKNTNQPTYSAVNGLGKTGSVYVDDECEIKEIYTNGWCKVKYPVSGGMKEAYCKTDIFINPQFNNYKLNITKNADVYSTSGLTKRFGTALTTDNITVVGETSGAYQVIYNVSGGYKLGWISKQYATTGMNAPGSSQAILTTPLKGIDVSIYNGNIDWARVKASGIDFAIIQLGYRGYGSSGSLNLDANFKKNIENATAAGVKVGVYFFTQAINTSEAIAEANFVINNIKAYKIDYPVVIDIEHIPVSTARTNTANLTRSTRSSICRVFCDTVKNAGYTPAVYSNQAYIADKMNQSELGGYDIWLASYTSKKPELSYSYTMWQYSESGSVPGISGNVDMNYCYKNYAANSSPDVTPSQPAQSVTFVNPMKGMYVCGNNWKTYYRAKGKYHIGIDVSSNTGNYNVYAITDGVVSQVGYNSANGNTISVKHTISGKTVYAFYAHLSSQSVKVGQTVTAGTKLGVMGNTGGSSTGPHLHFGITTMNSAGTYGYATSFTGDKAYYQGNYYYNPHYVLKYGKLPA